ncbi:triose-phosphate isomerase [Petroclostridium sp. X23]|uniref:triose-phosphate isomerase n=1 Tax=Petroclostridium sp. X23 TaxID=3045146 RepID=UPI0024AE0456|nr:triose-phosphate isomerase [Petroclostridium sp. X23]WHH57126.1 triose-phosphate isomerase [Petroclostridium sp. X23]
MSKTNKVYLGTNTKMYKNISDTLAFLTQLHELTEDISRDLMELFVIPSFTALDQARKAVPQNSISIGAQNMHWQEKGQFTGEISPLMLKEVGVKIIEIGHSERRQLFKETDIELNHKVISALEHGFTALLCVGETEEQKENGYADKILRMQLKIGLDGVNPLRVNNIWVAYEPVWAIGINGKPASKEYAAQKHLVIKDTLIGIFGTKIGASIPVLYGGSVNNQNAPELIEMKNIDGLFIGRSAWEASNFNKIIRNVLPLFAKKTDEDI